MSLTHFLGLIPLIAFFIIMLRWQNVVTSLLVLGYCFCLGWIAVINTWELVMFPPLVAFGIISIIIMVKSALRGDLV